MCYNGMGDGMLNESLLDKKKRYLVVLHSDTSVD